MFASWVAWFYDTLDDWYFREMWPDFRGNYTDDVRDIFDLGIALFKAHESRPHRYRKGREGARPQAETRVLQGGSGANAVYGDRDLAEQDEHHGDGAAAISGLSASNADLAWATHPATAEAAARFFARTIGGDLRYISHGEIQCGLSPDGKNWAPGLETLFIADLRDMDDDQGLLVARAANGAIAAAAIVEWVQTPRVRFGVLADLSVDPALRSAGLGARMVEEISQEAQRRDMQWLFLESGKDNAGAHDFFERHGFEQVSQVFARRL